MSLFQSINRVEARIKFAARAVLILGPLMAMTAQAGPVTLPTSGFTCTFRDATTGAGGKDCPAGEGAVAQLGNGGVSFSISPGGITLFGNGSLLEGTFGQVAAAIPAGSTVSWSYDFFLTETTTDPNWAIEMQVEDEGPTPGAGPVIGSTGFLTGVYGTTRTEFSASGSLTTTLATNANDYIELAYILNLTGLPGGNPFTTVEVPGGASVDFSITAPAGVPEPSSLGLLGAGIALLGWKRRSRR